MVKLHHETKQSIEEIRSQVCEHGGGAAGMGGAHEMGGALGMGLAVGMGGAHAYVNGETFPR